MRRSCSSVMGSRTSAASARVNARSVAMRSWSHRWAVIRVIAVDGGEMADRAASVTNADLASIAVRPVVFQDGALCPDFTKRPVILRPPYAMRQMPLRLGLILV